MKTSTFHVHIGPKAKSWVKRDHAVISPSYTRDYPFVIARGKGSEVWDVDGKRYIDFSSGIAVLSTGHAHPAILKAIQDQAKKFIHMSGTDFYYPIQVELAEKLAAIAPMKGDVQVFFTNSGTEANEAAIKLAKYTTGRPRFIGFLHSFHGRSTGALAFTSSKITQQTGFFPTMTGVTHIPYADAYRPVLSMNGFTDYGERVVDYLEKEIFTTIVPPTEVAGILVEPIQGEGGYIVPTPGFFKALRRVCDKYGILLIADEVQTGMARTGKWWGIEHFGVEPDMITTAKGIASGMPLGAMIAKKSVMTWGKGAHASTFGGNPVSCAAALATIKILEKSGKKNAEVMGKYIMKKLEKMKAAHPIIGDVRGRGLMIGVDLVKNRDTHEPDKESRTLMLEMGFNNGLLLLGCGPSTVRIIPPLTITKKLVDEGLNLFEKTLTEVEKGRGEKK